MKTHLLIIDPQYDFCSPKGSLYVDGARDDMIRLARMIEKEKEKIDAIHVTLDQHNTIHIAHPVFWKDPHGKHPDPFTIISLDDLKRNRWVTTKPAMMERATLYVKELENRGRYNLCIWPPHCIKYSLGATIVPQLHEAIQAWETERFTALNVITKGENIWTEHYSAVRAEVPDPDDPTTDINKAFIDILQQADIIFIAGEALSHCVASTVRDISEILGDENISRLVLLEDTTSPVKGFEKLAADFMDEMVSREMRVATTRDFI